MIGLAKRAPQRHEAAEIPTGMPTAETDRAQWTRFTTDYIWDFDWTPDNRLILARGTVNQGLVLISNRENR